MTPLEEISAAALPDLRRFLQTFPGLEGAPEFWDSRFKLWWDENPAFAAGVPRGWLLRDGAAVAGSLINVPSFVQIEGRSVAAFSTSTWMVLPEHRARSLELLMTEMDAAKGSALFNGTPTAEVASVLENLDFQPLPWGEAKESLLALDGPACAGALSGVPLLSAPAGWGLSLWQAMKLDLPKAPGYEAGPAETIGPEFDDLWEETRGLYANTNVRSAAALRWHAAADPFVPKSLLACRKGRRLTGFMIFKERRRRGLRCLDCSDFWAAEPLGESLAALVAAAREHGARLGCALASFPHFSMRVASALRSYGMLETGVIRRGFVWKDGPPLDPQNSYFVALQGDAGTSPS